MHSEYIHKMPFELTNGPATVQALMNSTFKPLLQQCVSVFVDDILVYSKIRATHVHDLARALTILREQKLFVKESKCSFRGDTVEYLGHVILAKGVATDSSKIDAVRLWPRPQTVK